MYFVYFLQSEQYKRFYIGSTGNPEERLRKHNNGSSKSTRPFRPWGLIYLERHETKNDAMKREYHLKSPRGYKEKREIIESHTTE